MREHRTKAAIVTGAAFGIGRAIATSLAEAGYDIGIFDLDEAGARETATIVERSGQKAIIQRVDVTDAAGVSQAVAAASKSLGGVDVLVNNAGIVSIGPFLETSRETWQRVFAVNVEGVFNMCGAILPDMIERRSGCVINMASWAGKKGAANHSAYSSSKGAIIALTQSLATEMAPHGIRVNSVCPGIIVDTKMRDQAEKLSRNLGLPPVEARVASIPLGRAGLPGDVASVVAFLVSDGAAYMTGQAINVTGGVWMN